MKLIKDFTSNKHNFLKQSYRYFLITGLLIFVIFAGMNLLTNSFANFRTTQAAGSDFSTFGKDGSTGSITETKPGNDVDWINSYSNNTNNVISSLDITNSIPTGTDFVGGSLKVPPGFTANFSTNSGTNYSAVEPSPANTVNNIKATGINVPNNANGQGQVQGFGPVLGSPAATASGGDGSAPIPFEHSTGNRVYTIFHHNVPPISTNVAGTAAHFNINCVVVSSSSICPGYPKYFSTTAGSSNTGPHDIGTSFGVRTETVGVKVFYAAQTNATNGIGCFDMEVGTNCGYYSLGSLPRFPAGVDINTTSIGYFSSQEGVVRSGDNLYTIGNDVKYYCFSITTLSACAGQPYNLATTSNPGDKAQIGTLVGDIIHVNGKLYSIQNYYAFDTITQNRAAIKANAQISCLDAATKLACTGFSVATIPNTVQTQVGSSTGNFSNAYSLYPIQNVLNQAIGICVTGQLNLSGNTFCINKDTGTSVSPPPITNGIPASGINTGLTYIATLQATIVRNKIYIPLYPQWIGSSVDTDSLIARKGGAIICFDFINNGRCAGFGNDGFVEPYTQGISINNGADGPQTYGFSYNNGCMLGLGNSGILWSFNPDTGATPCNTSAAPSVVKPSGFYCDGATHTITWNKVSILDTFLATGLTDVITKVYDKNGIFLKQGSVLAASSSLLISDIPYGTGVTYNTITGLDTTELQVETNGYGTAAGLTGLVGKKTLASFNGDNPQVCFKTKIKNNFTAATVTNTANITYITPATTSASLTVVRTFDPTIDLPTLTTLTGLSCTPTSVPSESTTTCSGTFPSNIIPPTTLALNVIGQDPITCAITAQVYSCPLMKVGLELGSKLIYGKIGTGVVTATDKAITVVARSLNPETDLANLFDLTGMTCSPAIINTGGTIGCGGAFPVNIIPPTALKLNVIGQLPAVCVLTGQAFTCPYMAAGSVTGQKAIQGQIDSNPAVTTDKKVEVVGTGGFFTLTNQSSSSKSSSSNTSQNQSSSISSKSSSSSEVEKSFKTKIKITDPYICSVGSYGNVLNARASGVEFVYYDFYKDQSASPNYSFKLKLNNNGDFFLPISKSTNIINEGEYKVIYYANDGDGGKVQGEYSANISDNCPKVNPPLVRSGGISVLFGTFFMLILIGYFAFQNHIERNKKLGDWKKM
jgi:hypothetical protein